MWSWSTGCLRGDAWQTRHAIAIMGTAMITDQTRSEICRILAWDLKQLESGVYDVVDHNGRFHPLNSMREKLGNQKMALKGVIGLNWQVFMCDLLSMTCMTPYL